MNELDFSVPVDRRGTDSEKWSIARDHELPMWVADMDFPVAEPIRNAIAARAADGLYGYSVLPDAWYDAYVGWWRSRHGVVFEKARMMFSTGVMPAISCTLRALTEPEAGVIVQPPVYYVFFHAIRRTGRQIVENKLLYDRERAAYVIDFDDLECKAQASRTQALVLCNPQNPGGRIWSSEELERVAEICHRNRITVISDEIHADITRPGTHYTPFMSLKPIYTASSVSCISPTKAFNIAGLRTAAIVAGSGVNVRGITDALAVDQVSEGNLFAAPAAVAAFTACADWLDAVCRYIFDNIAWAGEFLAKHLPMLRAVPQDATYLMWIDCSAVTDNSRVFSAELRRKTGLIVSSGHNFGGNGRFFIRINVACPRSQVEDGMERLRRFVAQECR